MKFVGNPIRSLSVPTAVPLALGQRGSEAAKRTDEPDCSPRPFDILAVYALYQKVR